MVKLFGGLNILVSFLSFQERKGRFKESHLQGSFVVSNEQTHQPLISYKNWKGNIIGLGRESQMRDCVVGDEFSMGVIKMSPGHAHVHTHMHTHTHIRILISVQLVP